MSPAPEDRRSPMAIAADWSSRIITISLEMVLPGVAGVWADKRLGTGFLFTIAGFALGMTGAIWHLMQLTRDVRSPEGLNGQESPGRASKNAPQADEDR